MPPPLPDSEELTIKTAGKTVGGWTEWRVTRGVEQLPSYCDLRLTEISPRAPQTVIVPGSTCEVFLGADKLLTGYIDRYMPTIDKMSHEIRLVCRSKTEDLVDCCPDTEKLGWSIVKEGGLTIGEIAKKLCAQYSIEVSLPDGDPVLPTGAYFHIEAGHTVYFILQILARWVGMLLYDDGLGRLVISKGGTGGRATPVILGQNIERASVEWTVDQRFSIYRVLGIAPDPTHGHVAVTGKAFDTEVKRFRLRTIPAERVDPGELPSTQRAIWESNRRFGRGHQSRVTVTGARDGNGKIWWPNWMAAVDMAALHVKDDLVITQVTYSRSEEGTQTDMILMPVKGLSVEPLPTVEPVPQV